MQHHGTRHRPPGGRFRPGGLLRTEGEGLLEPPEGENPSGAVLRREHDSSLPGANLGALRQAGGEVGPEWLLTSNRIISFRDVREYPWNTFCNPVTARICDTHEWAATDDPDQRRDFVRLLNHCLRGFTRSLDLCYHRKLDCHYFPATPDLKLRSLTYRSLQQKASRDVFAVYYKKSDPDAVSHYRHSAFSGSFQRYAASGISRSRRPTSTRWTGTGCPDSRASCSPASSGSTATRQ